MVLQKKVRTQISHVAFSLLNKKISKYNAMSAKLRVTCVQGKELGCRRLCVLICEFLMTSFYTICFVSIQIKVGTQQR